MRHAYLQPGSIPTARSQTRAFSLVDLLVILAVVGILTALLFPVFAQGRQKTRNELCVGNLHQIYLATQLYVQDYDRVYPFAVTESIRKAYRDSPIVGFPPNQPYAKYIATLPNIQTVLDPYDGKNRDIFHCPYDTNPTLGYLETTNFATYRSSYEYNEILGLNGLRDADLENLATWDLADDVLEGWHSPHIGRDDDMNKRRGNVQFVDGHCKPHFFREAFIVYTRQGTTRDMPLRHTPFSR